MKDRIYGNRIYDRLISDINFSLDRSIEKHPDNQLVGWDVMGNDEKIYNRVVICANEAGEALRASVKYYHENDQRISKHDIREELLHTISTAIRAIYQIDGMIYPCCRHCESYENRICLRTVEKMPCVDAMRDCGIIMDAMEYCKDFIEKRT